MGFEFFGQDEEGIDKSQSLYSSFAKMEVRLKEYDRARVIYKVRRPPSRALTPFFLSAKIDLAPSPLSVLRHRLALSSLSTDYLARDPPNCTPRIRISRSNTARGSGSR